MDGIIGNKPPLDFPGITKEFTGDINTGDLNSPDMLEYTGSSNEVTITFSTKTIQLAQDGNFYEFIIKNKTDDFVIFTIETEGSETIDGETNLILPFSPFGKIKLYSDGSNLYGLIN